MTEPITHGQAGSGGMPTKGTTGITTTAEQIAISAMALNGSSRILSIAFQPAWHAAPNKTAKKTCVSIRRRSPARPSDRMVP